MSLLKNSEIEDISQFKLEDFELMNPSSIDEKKIKEDLLKNKDKTFPYAVQLALKGYSSKVEEIKTKYKNEVIDEKYLKENYSFKKPKLGDKLNEKDLTFSRICRVYRNEIRSFLENNEINSYLYNKYAEEGFDRTIIFPGCEYLDLDEIKSMQILKTYSNLDRRLGTNFYSSILNIMRAKGKFLDSKYNKLS